MTGGEPVSVTPIMGRPLCFRVGSRTQPGVEYEVDWIQQYCTCPQFHKTARRVLEETGTPLICFHMEQAMLVGWANYVETAREMLLAQ